MRKLLFFLVLFMSIFFITKAGYVIRGTTATSITPYDIKNYTLTFDEHYAPIAAVSMPSPLAFGTGKNSIAVFRADDILINVFPIVLPTDEPEANYDIEVRDFHHVKHDDIYVLCGTRGYFRDTHAFVAVMTGDFTTMLFMEYPEANVFYSICGDFDTPQIFPNFDYYVCGTKDNYGVIASVSSSSLQLLSFYKTEEPWAYHKIILLQNTDNSLRFVVSGIAPDNNVIGLTSFTPTTSPTSCYYWTQPTNPNSHCVVADYVLDDNRVVVASSHENVVTLNSAFFPLTALSQIYEYHYTMNIDGNPYYVQDIGAIEEDGGNIGISVAGYMEQNLQHRAWHGYVSGLSSAIFMGNNNYGLDDLYEHYKVRYDQNGKTHTGGYFQVLGVQNSPRGALFGTPLTNAPCDYIYPSSFPVDFAQSPASFSINDNEFNEYEVQSINSYESSMPIYAECFPFKGKTAPEFSILPPEKETEISTFYDRITVKDTPLGTKYQIYSINGQLIQTGTTNPEISTANLSKGMFILRLENEKVFKFVK